MVEVNDKTKQTGSDKDKSETINFIAKWYAENRLEPELRPVYKNKSKK